MELTKIQLTDNEAKAFIRFQRYIHLFDLLESIKAFETKSGCINIHFNAFGEIVSVAKEEHFAAKKVIHI